MKCNKVKKLFSYYMDNELEEDLRESFNQHLYHCPGCFDKIKQLQKTHEIVQNVFNKPKRVKSPVNLGDIFHQKYQPDISFARDVILFEWLFPLRARVAVASGITMGILVLVIAGQLSENKPTYKPDMPLIVKETIVETDEIQKIQLLNEQAEQILKRLL